VLDPREGINCDLLSCAHDMDEEGINTLISAFMK